VRSPLAAAAPGGSELATLSTNVVRLDVGAATTMGRVRKNNEDSFLVQHLAWANAGAERETALVVVADGLGAHDAGEEASAMVVGIVGGALLPLLAGGPAGRLNGATRESLLASITKAIQDSNQLIFEKSKGEDRRKRMGATGAVVVFWDCKAIIGHVGDARVYHRSGEKFTQVTRDQTLAARMVELGQLSPREANTHPARNDLTQAIGHQADVKPASYDLRLAAGDWVIVASDGLHAHLDPAALEKTLVKPPASARALAQLLVEQADRAGGSDNCTVAVVRCY
jgi:protein phosphatase